MSGTARSTDRSAVAHCRGSAVSAAGGRRGLPPGNAMLEIDPVARRHPQKIGGAPYDIVLELADLAVGIHQLPHHFDDAEPAGLIHRAHDNAGEMIKIDGLALDQGRGRDQLIRSTSSKPEAPFDQTMKLALFIF